MSRNCPENSPHGGGGPSPSTNAGGVLVIHALVEQLKMASEEEKAAMAAALKENLEGF